MLKDILTSLRLTIATLLVCSVVYPAAILGVAMAAVPDRAEGSLIRAEDGTVIGSRLVAQAFTQPEYLWPRPSAVDYDGGAAGGSNLGPSNPELSDRVRAQVLTLEADGEVEVPGELVAASGSGLDPHITLAGALYQAERIATARGVDPSRVEALLQQHSAGGSPWSPPLINVLEVNLELDARLGAHPSQ